MEHMEIIVHITKTGTVYKDKALIAYDTSTSKVLGIGEECNVWLNQSLVTVTSPLKDGKIASFQASVLMFKTMIKRAYEEGHYIANHGYSHNYSNLYKNAKNVSQKI